MTSSVKARDPTLPEKVGSDLGDVRNRLDLALEIADLAVDMAEQAVGPDSDTERLREMLLKLKGEKRDEQV